MVIVSYSAFYIVEPVSYYAALGLSGTYMGFLSGNLGNMRVPCAAIALDVTKSEAGTIQAEVASTMAVAGSIITNLIATTLAAIVGTAIVAILPENIKIGLQSYAAAGIYAASLGNFALKSPKLAGLAILIALVCRWFIPGMPSWCAIVISVFGTVFLSRAFYNSDKKKAAT